MSVQDMVPVRVPRKSTTNPKASEAELSAVRGRMRGFFARLTPEQERKVLAYRGDDSVVDPLPDPKSPSR